MAWIELHQAIWTHWKTYELAEMLGIDETYAAAHMIRLWTWALDNAPNGELTNRSFSIIAKGAGWKGNAEEFVQSAIKAGWIDSDGDEIHLHDWYDYAGRLLEKREANKERARKSRERTRNVRATYAQHSHNECATNANVAGLPNHTIPNHTEPNINLVGGVVDEPILDENFAKVYRTFEQEGFGTISPLLKDTIDHLVNDYTAEWTIRAMHEAAKQGIRKMSYVEGILRRWKAEGVDEPWKQEKVTPFPKRFSRSSTKPHIPVVEQRTGGKALSDDELAEALRLAQELESGA
jgi:DnaD/phage-associated family protein